MESNLENRLAIFHQKTQILNILDSIRILDKSKHKDSSFIKEHIKNSLQSIETRKDIIQHYTNIVNSNNLLLKEIRNENK